MHKTKQKARLYIGQNLDAVLGVYVFYKLVEAGKNGWMGEVSSA